MGKVTGVAAAGCIRTEAVDGEFLVAVFTVHLVTLLLVPFFGFIAGITGVKSSLYAAVRSLGRKEGNLFAAILEFIEVGFAISQLLNGYRCNSITNLHLLVFTQRESEYACCANQ